MRPSARLARIAPPAILTVSLMGVYLATLAPGLTWANSGADGGDLIAAAATGGVAHPTGYPLYLLLARFFQFLPLGSLAYRTNLMSAVTAAAACVLVYYLVIRFLDAQEPNRFWLAGLTAGFGFGLAPLVWSQAVITEVYSLHALFVVLLLYLIETPLSQRFTCRRKAILLGLAFGLALGNHITILFLLPVIVLAVFIHARENSPLPHGFARFQFDARSLGWCVLFIVSAMVVIYAALPLRAATHPPVNWGNPTTFSGFSWLVTGRLYQDQAVVASLPAWLERIQTTAKLFLQQFGLIGLFLGLTGWIVYFRLARLYASLMWIAAASTLFSIGYSTQDSYVYLIPAVLSLAVWMGFAVGRLMDSLRGRWVRGRPLIGILVLLILFIQAVMNWSRVNASGDIRAESFGRQVLLTAPRDAIVLAQGEHQYPHAEVKALEEEKARVQHGNEDKPQNVQVHCYFSSAARPALAYLVRR